MNEARKLTGIWFLFGRGNIFSTCLVNFCPTNPPPGNLPGPEPSTFVTLNAIWLVPNAHKFCCCFSHLFFGIFQGILRAICRVLFGTQDWDREHRTRGSHERVSTALLGSMHLGALRDESSAESILKCFLIFIVWPEIATIVCRWEFTGLWIEPFQSAYLILNEIPKQFHEHKHSSYYLKIGYIL